MITVNVWEAKWFSGSPGHASIEVGGIYVSFWPGEEAGTLKWKGFQTKTFLEDCQQYSATGQRRWFRNLPNDQSGPGLNEAAMVAEWKQILTSKKNYTVEFQCSAVVNELLIAGGCRKFAKPRLVDTETWVLGAVSPDDVKDYTLLLHDRIKTARVE